MIRIILPCYNEEANLPGLLNTVRGVLRDESYRVFAVDDGSRDRTNYVLRALARDHPVTLAVHADNRGVAETFRTGFGAVLSDADDNDVIVLMEGDGTSDPALLPEMARRARAGADLVIASRYRPGGGYQRFQAKRLLLSRAANAVFRLFFPIPGVADYTIFYRAYRVPPLRACRVFYGERFIESKTFLANAEILVKLRPFVRRVEEIPFLYDYGRKRGRSGMKIWRNLTSYLAFVARHARRGF